ncbi:MAG: DsbA family protein [bacterium]|nr:DsbA family protein [bacterium]
MDNTQKFSIPLAIIIAGALIAGAVYFASIGRSPVSGSEPYKYVETKPRSPTDAGQLSDIAKSLGLNVKAFESCMKDGTYADRVARDAEEVQAAGGQGTPHSVVLVGNQQIPIQGGQPF